MQNVIIETLFLGETERHFGSARDQADKKKLWQFKFSLSSHWLLNLLNTWFSHTKNLPTYNLSFRNEKGSPPIELQCDMLKGLSEW